MRRLLTCALFALLSLCTAGQSQAHFLVLLPADDVLSAQRAKTADLQILFTHPMEQGPVMELGKPQRFGMLAGGQRYDLSEFLRPQKTHGKTTYTASVPLKRPGDYVFFIEPAPYWEASEEKLIVHYAKVVVNFAGVERGWDAMVGLPVEIEPLVRPYGLWTGNTFRGIVRKDGKPVPFAPIEVEYYNEGGRVKPPNDAFITQLIKADSSGGFSYSMPKAGWWGFAALVDSEQKMKNPAGKLVSVELGGVIWVKTVDMK
jgi:cobalt/nickel transport protein